MTLWQWGLIALATLTLLGALATLALAAIKRKARTLAGYAPEITILCARLVDDPRVSPFDKLKLRALAWYLGLRLDLIRQYWPGPLPAPNSILRRAKGRARPATAWSSASL